MLQNLKGACPNGGFMALLSAIFDYFCGVILTGS